MENTKQYRVLEIFFRGLRGEDLSVQKLANQYNVSTKYFFIGCEPVATVHGPLLTQISQLMDSLLFA